MISMHAMNQTQKQLDSLDRTADRNAAAPHRVPNDAEKHPIGCTDNERLREPLPLWADKEMRALAARCAELEGLLCETSAWLPDVGEANDLSDRMLAALRLPRAADKAPGGSDHAQNDDTGGSDHTPEVSK